MLHQLLKVTQCTWRVELERLKLGTLRYSLYGTPIRRQSALVNREAITVAVTVLDIEITHVGVVLTQINLTADTRITRSQSTTPTTRTWEFGCVGQKPSAGASQQ